MTTSPEPLMVSTLDTPDGPFTLVEDGVGTVRAAGWTSDVPALLTRARIPAGRARVEVGAPSLGSAPSGGAAAVRAFYEGDPEPVSRVPVDQIGTEFQLAVWAGLRRIPPGATLTYGELAAAIGRPRAVRAVGAACGRNAVALFVPCHRVVGASGTLTGFAWGVAVKRHLLELEGVLSSATGRPMPRRCR
ncbi:MAG: methylated-DNA--[protein]-cysteine S-methyltransferase [Pauljensenia sp.]